MVLRVTTTLPVAPDTATAQAAADLAAAASAPPLLAHVWRTWHFGHHLLGPRVADADLEVAFVAAMLHDLGLTPRFDGDGPFEQEGARAAAELLAGQGWDPDRAGLVGEAIARHLDLASAEARPEVALVHLGAAADVVGLRVDQLPEELVELALATHPRDGFVELVSEALLDQVRRKPGSAIAALHRDVPFQELVADCPLDRR